MNMHVKKNDTVLVLSGKDKGKEGVIIAITPKNGKIMVKDVAVVVKHQKARKQGDVAGIKRHESFISSAKVMPICPSCKKACRVNYKTLESDVKVRVCNRCQETL